jgi:hypothetical protein
MDTTTTKIIKIPENDRKPIVQTNKNKRVITQSKGWTFNESDYQNEKQLDYLKTLITENTPNQQQRFILQQINNKLSGYKSQDVIKKIYNESAFIKIDTVIQLLIESCLHCFYCKNDIKVLYEVVRDTDQWTLDRIDNSLGHNTGNVFIACLSCNLRRKTMYHERYVFTKTCTNVVKLGKNETSDKDCA